MTFVRYITSVASQTAATTIQRTEGDTVRDTGGPGRDLPGLGEPGEPEADREDVRRDAVGHGSILRERIPPRIGHLSARAVRHFAAQFVVAGAPPEMITVPRMATCPPGWLPVRIDSSPPPGVAASVR
jgi:hypothetical protein